jgi:hypothetical protein
VIKVNDLRPGDTLVNRYGETVLVIVRKDVDSYAWVTLFGPPHFTIGSVTRELYKWDSEVNEIFDVYRGDGLICDPAT